MSIIPELRARVERLLKSDQPQVADIERLYIQLREKNYYRPRFHDLANFAAHADERDRGEAFKSANDMAKVLRFLLPALRGFPVDLSVEDFESVLKANYRLCGEKRMTESLSISRDKLRTGFGRLCRHVGGVRGGQVQWLRRPTESEIAIAKILVNSLSMFCVFDEETILDDFVHVLLGNGLLSPEEAPGMKRLGPFMVLHAASLMHGSRILLGPDDHSQLRITPGHEHKTLDVSAGVSVPVGGGQQVTIAHPILSIARPPDQLFADYPEWLKNCAAPLELRSDGKLHVIG